MTLLKNIETHTCLSKNLYEKQQKTRGEKV